MATAKLKRKPRLSKFESYKAAIIKEVKFRLKFGVVAHGHILGAVGKKKKLRRVTQTYLFRCRIAVGIDPRAPFLSILPRKPLKCGKTAQNGRFS